MEIRVQGGLVVSSSTIVVDVRLDRDGEPLPEVIVNITGGTLEIPKSHILVHGNFRLEPFQGNEAQE